MIRAKDTMMSSFRDSDERAKNSLEEMKNSELLRKKAENELSELATLEYANERRIKELKDRKKWLLTRIAVSRDGCWFCYGSMFLPIGVHLTNGWGGWRWQ